MNNAVICNALKKNSIPIIVSTILIVLFIAVLTRFWQDSRMYPDQLIVENLDQLQEIFTQIDKTCTIIGFEHHKNYIDFLNVEKFVGSEVGSMNLAHPDRWQGPYLPDNPTIQEQFFQIIKTKNGYYILPGDGVKLSNDKVIGKDIIIDESTDMQAIMSDPHGLSFKGRPLAVPLLLNQNTSEQKKAVLLEDDLLTALQFHYNESIITG